MSTKAWIRNYKIIDYAVWLFIFLIPWQARWIIEGGSINGGYWEYGTKSLYATEILLAAILVLMILSSRPRIAGEGSHGLQKWILSAAKKVASKMTSLAGAVFLMVVWAGLSVFWAIDKNVALIHWRFLVEAAVVFLLIRDAPTGPSVREKIKWAIIASAAIQAIIAITQFLTQSIPASTWLGMSSQAAGSLGPAVVETAAGRFLRAYGTFPHPNILGGWLVLGLVMVVKLLSRTERSAVRDPLYVVSSKYKRFLPRIKYGVETTINYALFIIILFGLLTTFSRSAWLALGAAMLYFFLWCFLERQSKFALKIVSLTAAVIVVFGAIYPSLLWPRFEASSRLEAKSVDERVVLTSNSLELIKKHPLLGVGFGNFGLAVQKEIIPNEPVWYYQPVHNFFLLVWSELGIVGLAIVLYSLWFMAFRFAFKTEARRISLFLLPVFVISLFDHYLWTLYPGLLILGLYIRFSSPRS